jgi:hypothetical protein
MSFPGDYLDDVRFSFRKHKGLADKAMVQVQADDDFFRRPGEHSNSIAQIVKHVAGNLRSRWTEFLTTDGEKPWRNRDDEFVIGDKDTRSNLMAAWEIGWAVLFETLNILVDGDLPKVIRIRGEEHTVLQATNRSLTHTTYHIGQIIYLARLVQTDGWEWLTIPPGGSATFTRKYRG